MDVGAQYLRQSEFVNNRVKTLRLRIATMRNTINDEEVYLLGTP